MECRVSLVRGMLRADREVCALSLCRNGSEMQQEFFDGVSKTPVAVVYQGIKPVAWAATHQWRDFQTLEGFTHELLRRRGIQRFAACGLIADQRLDIRQKTAVFAPSCVELTRSLGFSVVRLFQRRDAEWFEVPA